MRALPSRRVRAKHTRSSGDVLFNLIFIGNGVMKVIKMLELSGFQNSRYVKNIVNRLGSTNQNYSRISVYLF